MPKKSTPTGLPVSRRTALAAGAGLALTSLSGCTQVESALGTGLPSCSGEQRDVGKLSLGNSNSDVTVAVYADYSCPHCAEFAVNTYPNIKSNYIDPGKIEYVHRDFPIPVSDWAMPAANAVRSVQQQAGSQPAMNFGKMMYRAAQQQDNPSLDTIEARASNIQNANAGQVRTAADEQPYCEVIKNDKQQGEDRGVEGTPTVFVNQNMLEAPTLDELSSALDRALSN